LLAEKLNTDMELVGEKVLKMKQDYEQVIRNLKQSLSELQEKNELHETKLVEAEQALKIKEQLYADLSKNFAELEKQYSDLKDEVNLDVEHRVKQCEVDFMEKMAKMDEKLNEARREQAKAVVLMRQMERSSGREKERMESLLKSCDEYYQEHIKKLQANFISVEKEKNILATLVRQQQQGVSLDSNFLTSSNYVSKYSPGSVLKSPVGFFNKNIIADTNWFEEDKKKSAEHKQTDESMLEANKNTSESRNAAAELTSFWLNSKQSINVEDSYQNEKTEEDHDGEECDSESNYTRPSLNNDTADESSETKNIEILQQIRKIMGDLQLSDGDDDSENETESLPAFRHKSKFFVND
jgi:hypothetical protein